MGRSGRGGPEGTTGRAPLCASALLACGLAVGCQLQAPEGPAPRLTALAPNHVSSGQMVILQGAGFATEPAMNAVYFGNARARVDQATPNELRVEVPVLEMAVTGQARVAVRVIVSGRESDSLEIDIETGGVVAEVVTLDADSQLPASPGAVGVPPAAATTPVSRSAATPAPPPVPAATAAPSPTRPAPTPSRAPSSPPAPQPPAPPAPPELAEAEAQLAADRPEQALALFEKVLARDAAHAAAVDGRQRAQAAIRERRALVTAETRVTGSPSASGSAPAGFASDDVEVAGQASPGRVEFECSPERPQPGARYRLKVYLLNQGKERIDVDSMAATIVADGAPADATPALRNRRVDAGKRVQLAEMTGSWGEQLETWSLEVTINSTAGIRYASEVVWK